MNHRLRSTITGIATLGVPVLVGVHTQEAEAQAAAIAIAAGAEGLIYFYL